MAKGKAGGAKPSMSGNFYKAAKRMSPVVGPPKSGTPQPNQKAKKASGFGPNARAGSPSKGK